MPNFALKVHTVLCLPYVKGKDWYINWKEGTEDVRTFIKPMEQGTF